jgi:hypothetical protein
MIKSAQKVVPNRELERNKAGEKPYLILFRLAEKFFLADGKNIRSEWRKTSQRPLRSLFYNIVPSVAFLIAA